MTDRSNYPKLKSPIGVRPADMIRHSALPVIGKFANPILGNWGPSSLREGDAMLIQQGKEVVSTIERTMTSFGKTDSPLDIVFLTIIGGHRYLFATEALLGLTLKARGHRVRHVVCDQFLPACESKKSTNVDRWESTCGRCWSFGRHLQTSFGLEVLPFSDSQTVGESLVRQETIDEIVAASLLKYFMVGQLDGLEDIKERQNAYIESAKKSLQLGNFLANLNPDRVIMSHGIYSTWGPARETLNAANIPVLTYGKGKKKSTIKFNWTTSADWWDVSEEWEKKQSVPLTDQQESQIDEYLSSRRSHKADSMVYNFGEEESEQETIKKLGLNPDLPIYTAFTNVLWDAASAQREIAFDNPIQWIFETIAWFKEQPDKQLIVKIHPAEKVIGTQQPFAKLIQEEFSVLPSNIRIIEPHEKTNSWSIAKITTLGLVHTSTVGMELPLEGTPVAVVSRTHFRDRGFTIDVESKAKYFELLADFDLQSVDRELFAVLAKRYAYLLFERYQFPFDYFFEPTHADIKRFDIEKLATLGKSDLARVFINQLESGKGSFLIPENSP